MHIFNESFENFLLIIMENVIYRYGMQNDITFKNCHLSIKKTRQPKFLLLSSILKTRDLRAPKGPKRWWHYTYNNSNTCSNRQYTFHHSATIKIFKKTKQFNHGCAFIVYFPCEILSLASLIYILVNCVKSWENQINIIIMGSIWRYTRLKGRFKE